MKSFIKFIAILILIFSILRIFANVIFGVADYKLFLHVFASILWVIAAIGMLNIQNWGRILALWLSVFCAFLFIGYSLTVLITGHNIESTPEYLLEFVISLVWISALNLKHVKKLFCSRWRKTQSR